MDARSRPVKAMIGRRRHRRAANMNDDKAGKPEGIHLMIGRRPYAAFGNSTGDRQMLEYTGAGDGARLMMLVLHDDPKREYAYGRPGASPTPESAPSPRRSTTRPGTRVARDQHEERLEAPLRVRAVTAARARREDAGTWPDPDRPGQRTVAVAVESSGSTGTGSWRAPGGVRLGADRWRPGPMVTTSCRAGRRIATRRRRR
jgi:hypothetical protein